MNSLAHSTLPGLVIEFFYSTGSNLNSMGSLFPKDFASEVPHTAVALTATAIMFLQFIQ